MSVYAHGYIQSARGALVDGDLDRCADLLADAVDGPGRPHLLPVLCTPCAGAGRLERIVAVEVGPNTTTKEDR